MSNFEVFCIQKNPNFQTCVNSEKLAVLRYVKVPVTLSCKLAENNCEHLKATHF